jgi:hypothetical protein
VQPPAQLFYAGTRWVLMIWHVRQTVAGPGTNLR